MGIPPWAWLNPLAHGTPIELATLAARDRTDQTSPADVHDTSWAAVVAMLASELVDDDDVGRQQEALVRLKLQLAAGATQISTRLLDR